MTSTNPHTHRTTTLADRLRALADELESAERYGITLPRLINAGSNDITWHTPDPAEFAQWADYTEADVKTLPAPDGHYVIARADMNGLTVQFQTLEQAAEAVA